MNVIPTNRYSLFRRCPMQNVLTTVVLFLVACYGSNDPLPYVDPNADLQAAPQDMAHPACRGRWTPTDPHDPSNGCLGQEQLCRPCRDDRDCCGPGLEPECTPGGTLVTYSRACDHYHQCTADFRGECKPPGG